jgi:hypothetical protein
LTVEQELGDARALDGITVLLTRFVHGLRATVDEGLIPLGPGPLPVRRFQNAEQGIIVQPPLSMLVPEIFVFCIEAVASPLLEAVCRLRQNGALDGYQAAIVHEFTGQAVEHTGFLRVQQPKPDQRLEPDQVCIAGKRRQRLVRRVAVSRGGKWQELPYADAHLAEPVDECH